MKIKKTLILLLPVVILAATRSTADPGMASSDGSNGVAVASQIDQATEGGAEVRYLVPHMRSAQFATGVGGRVTTVITATNGGTTACNVTIDYHFAFNTSTTPVCSLTLNLVPLLGPGTDSANACSRSIAGDRWTLCTETCSPSLSFIQGKALIRVPESCAGAVSFDARLYHSDTSEDIRAINALQVMRLPD